MSTARMSKTRREPAASSPEPDLKSAIETVVELMGIPGVSGQERAAHDRVRELLLEAGCPASAITSDDVYRRSPLGGEVGNLIVRLTGTIRAPRRLLMAHLDTVPLCVGSKPKRQGREVRSADPKTGLGADNRAGCAVVLTAAREILRRKLPHPPLTLLWAVQEEVGLFGSHYIRVGQLGKPKLAFNWDGGPSDKLTVGATGAYRIGIEIHGLASHAGGAPERGVSAITIAALAIAELHRGGWLGLVKKGRRLGTTNVGVIQGGAATNVITDFVQVRAEARSHDRRFRRKLLRTIEQAFHKAAAAVRSFEGVRGSAEITSRLDYESFRLADDEPSVIAAENAVRAIGREPLRAITNGGLDANWLSAHGIPTVTLGCGQRDVHTTSEALDLDEFEAACRIGLRLATGTENATVR